MVLHLDGLHCSLKICVLHPIFVLFILFSLLRSIKVTLVMLGWLPDCSTENFPPLFGFVYFFVLVGSLMKFPILPIFLLHSLGIPICMVHVGVFLDMGIGIHGGCWVHTLAWRGQRFFADHIYSLVWCHSTVHHSNLHPPVNIFWWILWDDLHVFFDIFYSKIINNQWKCDWIPFVLPKGGRVSE